MAPSVVRLIDDYRHRAVALDMRQLVCFAHIRELRSTELMPQMAREVGA